MLGITRLDPRNPQASTCRSMLIPRRSHHTDNVLNPKNVFGAAKGTPLSVRIAGECLLIKFCVGNRRGALYGTNLENKEVPGDRTLNSPFWYSPRQIGLEAGYRL
jgi:hypothetical protein|tara:strand:- start:2042 stop:2356 length:315 start_codon:yes stop_codon:yes gene_type:complete